MNAKPHPPAATLTSSASRAATRAPAGPASAMVTLLLLGAGILACTLSNDFEPTNVDPPREVQEVTGSQVGIGGASTCTEPRGCCASDQDCGGTDVCVAGFCQTRQECVGQEVSACQLALCPGPNCPMNEPSCTDGARNGDETGVDCGGSCPNACSAPPPPESCSDRLRNQDETGVDCGGSCADRCAAGQGCGTDGDCAETLLCSPSTHLCAEISCADGIQNGAEILVDCGGGTCPGCPVGTACVNATDCSSAICALGTCRLSPLCEDQELNGQESDIDCGGPDQSCERCPDGDSCQQDDDCDSDDCAQGTCVSCGDGVRNGTETDDDCGGPDLSCRRCPDGDSCQQDRDCSSGDCAQGTCISCDDGVRNGTETDDDCGGPDLSCRRCPNNQSCAQNRDCQSNICSAAVCVTFSCNDNLQNGNETGVDCGGNGVGCDRCPDGSGCGQTSDCEAGSSCAGGVCISCDDDVQNGTETDVDCGGANAACARCAPGLDCAADSDCASGACVGGSCCGGTQADCTRCAERLSPTIDCDVPSAGQDSTGVNNCRAFLQCLADNIADCPTRNTPGCSGDNQTAGGDACPHNNFGGNAGTGLTRVNQVLQNAGCQL